MSTRRIGMSIAEVLVVLLIVGLLLAILLPAVQRARESARRAQCASNLKQIALAVHAYEQSQRRLPALYTGPFGEDVFGVEQFYLHGWQSLVLPQLEEENLYRRIDFSKLATHVTNEPAISTRLSVYLCPSASRSQEVMDRIPSDPFAEPILGVTVTAAATDYQPTAGVVLGPRPFEPRARGVQFGAWGEPIGEYRWDNIIRFSRTRELSFKHVTDGLTRTTLICEAAGRPDRISQEGVRPYNPEAMDDSYVGSEAATWAASAYYYYYLLYQYEAGTDYPARGGVNTANMWETLYSFHPQGVHVAMCDGSVQFLADDTAISVLQAQITRDRGD